MANVKGCDITFVEQNDTDELLVFIDIPNVGKFRGIVREVDE